MRKQKVLECGRLNLEFVVSLTLFSYHFYPSKTHCINNSNTCLRKERELIKSMHTARKYIEPFQLTEATYTV